MKTINPQFKVTQAVGFQAPDSSQLDAFASGLVIGPTQEGQTAQIMPAAKSCTTGYHTPMSAQKQPRFWVRSFKPANSTAVDKKSSKMPGLCSWHLILSLNPREKGG